VQCGRCVTHVVGPIWHPATLVFAWSCRRLSPLTVLADLIAVVNSELVRDDGFLTLVRAERTADRATIVLELYGAEPEPQTWQVTCRHLHSWQLGHSALDRALCLTDHILLAEYQGERATLGIKGAVRHAPAVIAELWARHVAVAGRWIPFGRFFNPRLTIDELLVCGAATLAEGPKQLLSEYAEIINRHGAEVYEISSSSVEALEREDQMARDFIELFVLGEDTWLIGVGFSADRLEPVTAT
jgi:hypothetical protein